MINSILSGIFTLITSLVNLILTPIDLLIDTALPSLGNALDMVSGFFNWVANLVPWAISWFGLNETVIGLFVAYTTFELTIPLGVHTVKLCLQWYDKLKP